MYFKKILLNLLLVFMFIPAISIAREVCFIDRDACIHAEIADSPQKRQVGLMHVDKLDRDNGMLFIFDTESPRSFWMKNMKIPLDIIWISRGLKVVHITENIYPCLKDPCPIIKSDQPSKYALEVNTGYVGMHNIKVGDSVVIK